MCIQNSLLEYIFSFECIKKSVCEISKKKKFVTFWSIFINKLIISNYEKIPLSNERETNKIYKIKLESSLGLYTEYIIDKESSGNIM